MFEDSLVESTGRIRTLSRWYAIGSFVLQATFLAALILIDYVYPDALPKQALSRLLVAPPPPAAPAEVSHTPAAHNMGPVQLSALTAPSMIPRHIPSENSSPELPGIDRGLDQDNGEVPGALILIDSTPPPPPVVSRSKPSGPMRISAGVAAGHLLTPIQPIYPAIARSARMQGTVVLEAMISKEGFVEQARVISGSPLLAQAALAAVNRARYQPYKLNGEPVDVETTINIIFTLDN